MKLIPLLLLPALLCTVPAHSRAALLLKGIQKSTFIAGPTPIFPAVNSIKQIAISGSSISFPGRALNTISGLICVNTATLSTKYKIENDSICAFKKTIKTISNTAINSFFNAANANLTSAIGMLHPKSGVNTLTNESIAPGITTFNKDLTIAGSLTFLNQSDTAALFVVRVTGNLTITDNMLMMMEHETSLFNHVYFQVTGTTTIGANVYAPAQFISAGAITLGTASLSGILCTKSAVSLNGNTSVNTLFDTDGDGVADDFDDFPNQANKANNNMISSQTVAFEDLWPKTGDFDMNDMVMSFDYNMITDSKGYLTEIIGNYQMIATGGVLHNGFGVEFPFLRPSDITMCIEASPSQKRGVQETGQNNAVILFFSDMRKEMSDWNTFENAVHYSAPTLYTVSFRINKKIMLSDIATDGFNPFIYRMNGNSRSEVHLPGHQPTTLADNKLFHTADDNTTPGTSTTYISKTNLPFAIMLPTALSAFQYPIEVKDICATYLHFASWATSNGTLFPDWYSNTTDAGYRNTNIYLIPNTITN